MYFVFLWLPVPILDPQEYLKLLRGIYHCILEGVPFHPICILLRKYHPAFSRQYIQTSWQSPLIHFLIWLNCNFELPLCSSFSILVIIRVDPTTIIDFFNGLPFFKFVILINPYIRFTTTRSLISNVGLTWLGAFNYWFLVISIKFYYINNFTTYSISELYYS